MIRAGADQRQAQRDVHALRHAGVLDRYQPLVMVHRNHRIKLAGTAWRAACPHKYGVWREGAAYMQALSFGGCYRRGDDGLLLGAE